MLDPLGVVTRMRGAQVEEESLADAPSTITNREEASRPSRQNLFYMPQAQAVPEIAVPDFLPDLVGGRLWASSSLAVGEVAKLVKVLAWGHFPAVYNLQRHQSSIPIIPCLYGVGG